MIGGRFVAGFPGGVYARQAAIAFRAMRVFLQEDASQRFDIAAAGRRSGAAGDMRHERADRMSVSTELPDFIMPVDGEERRLVHRRPLCLKEPISARKKPPNRGGL